MDYKDILKLRGLGDFFKDLSAEHYDYMSIDDVELRAYHKGKSNAYALAADRIDKLIENEKDISKE